MTTKLSDRQAKTKRKAKRAFKGRGTIRIDRKFAQVGRLALASGLRDPLVFKQLDEFLTRLDRAGRSDILRLVKDRDISPRQILDLARQLSPVVSLAELNLNQCLRFQDVLASVRQSSEGTAQGALQHHRNMLNGLSRMLTVRSADDRDSVLMKDLPQLAKEYRTHCENRGLASEWNHTRAYLRAFLKLVLGCGGELTEQVKALAKLRHEPKLKRGPIDLDMLRILDYLTDPETATIIRMMAASGMGPKEYFQDGWRIEKEGYLWINGRKRKGRLRVVPLVCVAEKPSKSFATFRRRFAELQAKLLPAQRFTIYDLRRTFGVALIRAGVPAIRHHAYLGHGPRTVTHVYQEEVVVSSERIRELHQDAEKFKRYFRLDTVPVDPNRAEAPGAVSARGE